MLYVSDIIFMRKFLMADILDIHYTCIIHLTCLFTQENTNSRWICLCCSCASFLLFTREQCVGICFATVSANFSMSNGAWKCILSSSSSSSIDLHREAEKRNQFSFVCICLVLDRNWWIFSHTLGLRKVDL